MCIRDRIYAIIRYGNEEDKIYKQLQESELKNNSLTAILAHMENNYKTVTSEVSAFSELAEKWASQINSFANNIKQYGSVSDKAWNKVKITDSICIYTRNVIQQYCNNFDNSNYCWYRAILVYLRETTYTRISRGASVSVFFI